MTTRKDHKSTGKNHAGKNKNERNVVNQATKAADAITQFIGELEWADIERNKGYSGVAGLLCDNARDKLIDTVKKNCPDKLMIEATTMVHKNGIEAYARYIDEGITIVVSKKPLKP